MRLTELSPRWFTVSGKGMLRQGMTFECPCAACLAGYQVRNGAGMPHRVRLAVQFANPIDGPPQPLMSNKEKLEHVHELLTFDVGPGFLWKRTGEDFETMSITPSVDASASGHWHGFITNGVITP